MSDEKISKRRSSRTDDDAVSTKGSTDDKRAAFGKGRALSSKALGSKKQSVITAPATAEEKERLKKELLKGPEKKKKKAKEEHKEEKSDEAAPSASEAQKETAPAETTPAVAPLKALPPPILPTSPSPRSPHLENSSPRPFPSSPKRPVPPATSGSPLPPPIAPASSTSDPNPSDPHSSRSLHSSGPHSSQSPRAATPETQDMAALPPPIPVQAAPAEAASSFLPPPPPPIDDLQLSPADALPPPPPEDDSDEDAPPPPDDDSYDLPGPPPDDLEEDDDEDLIVGVVVSGVSRPSLIMSNSSSDVGTTATADLSLPPLSTSPSSGTVATKKKKKIEKSPSSISTDGDEKHAHTRDRSGTKSRRDSVSLAGAGAEVSPLALANVPLSSGSGSPNSARGSMRLNRTPRGENISSPRGQIIIITPRGEVLPDAPGTPDHSSLASSLNAAHRDSVDSDDSSMRGSLSLSLSDVPNVPQPIGTPNSGSAPPPPPPMPTGGAGATSAPRIGAREIEGEDKVRVRSRRVVPEVEDAIKKWDCRATDFEIQLATEIARKGAPEELLEFPHDDLIIEILHSDLQHYPPLEKDTPQSIVDAYSTFTMQLKMIHHQSEWYGTKTSQKERLKEYEIRVARAKAEAEKLAASQPPTEIKTTIKREERAARRASISRAPGEAGPEPRSAGGRRASRAIKMTTAEEAGVVDKPTALPEAAEDEESSALESSEMSVEQDNDKDDSPAPPEVQVSLTASSPGPEKKKPGSTKHKLKISASSGAESAPASPASARTSLDVGTGVARPASPDSRARQSGTIRGKPSVGEGDKPAPAHPKLGAGDRRLSARSLSGLAGSTADLGSLKSTFELDPKMMALDEKVRRKEAAKAEAERKGIFEVFTPISINSEASDHVQPVEPLRPKVHTRIMMHFKNIRFNVGYEEPFFISAAYYDIEKRIRLTETFYVDFNDQNELLKSLLAQYYAPGDPESLAKRYVANLNYQSPNIYLIIRVNTVLHGDIDDIADLYGSSSVSAKDKQKLMDGARQATSLLGRYQQGFGWAALQVFDERSNFKLNEDNMVPLNKMKYPLSDENLFDTLTAEEKPKQKVLDATVSIGAYMCTRDKFQLLNCVDSSLVHWPPEQAPSLEQKNDKAGAILKSLIKPPTPVNDIVREVDLFEQPFDKPAPYWNHIHNLYVYPMSFNITSSKLKAKTMCARVYLMHHDDGPEKSALPAIFARCADKNLTPHAITSVWWETTSAVMWDEIKVKLPHRIGHKDHLLFVFYSINVKLLSKKKEGANEAAETPIAFSWLPLKEHGIFRKDGSYTLPLAAIPASGTPAEYLGKREPEYIDTEKATFTFQLRLMSTVITQDEHLASYFSSYDEMCAHGQHGSKEKKKMLEQIGKADPKVVLKFFPMLYNQLFAQLCSTKSHSLQQAIFRAICVLSQRVFDQTMVSGKLSVSDALYAYAIHYYDVPQKALHNPADVIAANWVVLLENATGAKALAEAGITPTQPLEEKLPASELSELQQLANFSLKDVSWFFFEIIFKSLVLNMAASGDSRRQITSPQLQQSIVRLVQFVDLHRRGIGSGFDHINRVLARTFNRLFSLTDRGLVLDLIYSHLSKLEGDNAAAVFKLRFLQIITDYEHYVPLNLPVFTPIDSIEVLPQRFWQKHYLAGLYLNLLRSSFLAGEDAKLTRTKAISRFRDLIWKHHLDDRYQLPDHRSRIASMYFPLFVMLTEKVLLLIEKTQKDEAERYEWCLCALWIFRYMNRDIQLRNWWRGENTENLVNLFNLLKYCLDSFSTDEPMREEIVYIMAETYDLFMDDLDEELQQDGSKVMEAFSLSLLNLIRIVKTEKLLVRLLQIVRTYVIKFKRPLFRFLANYTICGDLTYEVFNLCQSQPKKVMQCATSVLYLMLRTNNDEMGHFARMKLQSTSAVSKLVRREGCNYDELRNCLEAMALYKDSGRAAASWDNQIREFINRHARIIRDNLRASATPVSFADKKAEIFFQISMEYIYSPDLRITWLSNLAQHHESVGSLEEAAVCKVQIASLVAEYMTQILSLKQALRGVPEDPAVFSHAFPAIKDEKNFSTIWLEGNTILSPVFSEDGFVKALNEAVDLFNKSEDMESAAEIQLILANYFKENRRWEMLAPLGTQISTVSQKLYETNRAQSRVPPNFYRVAFFGKGFEEDDGKEYIYRVNPSLRLADFTTAMKDRYTEKFGAENFEILGNKPIEEYEHVDVNKKNYLQIVNCEIYCEYDELTAKDRLTYSDRSFDVKKFFFETPYNPEGGRPSEEVSKTWKRKIILWPAKTFPYLLTRVPVKKKEIALLNPIESAVDLLLIIVSRFKEALNCVPPNTKTVQIILQGAVLTQVNAGPLAIIREFLGNASKYPEAEVAKITEQARHFVRLCQFGLRLNAALIDKEPSLAPLHEEMTKAFKVLQAEAGKHIDGLRV